MKHKKLQLHTWLETANISTRYISGAFAVCQGYQNPGDACIAPDSCNFSNTSFLMNISTPSHI